MVRARTPEELERQNKEYAGFRRALWRWICVPFFSFTLGWHLAPQPTPCAQDVIAYEPAHGENKPMPSEVDYSALMQELDAYDRTAFAFGAPDGASVFIVDRQWMGTTTLQAIKESSHATRRGSVFIDPMTGSAVIECGKDMRIGIR